MTIAFSSIRTPQGLPENCQDLPGGGLVGDALVPNPTCQCNCGLSASIDLGNFTLIYNDGSTSINQTYNFVDAVDVRTGADTLDPGEYIAWVEWSEADDGCQPQCWVLVDAAHSGAGEALAYVRVGLGGVGELGIGDWANPDGFGKISNYATLDRPGIVYGGVQGTYSDADGSITFPQDILKKYRAGTLSTYFNFLINQFNDIPL